MLDMDDHAELWQPPAALIDRQRLAGLPRQGIGRGLKVAKEQIVALLVALEAFVNGESDARLADDHRRLTAIAGGFDSCPVECRIEQTDSQSLPLLEITLDEQQLGRSAMEVCRRLRAGSPPCYVGHALLSEAKLLINPLHLDDPRSEQLTRRLREELTP